VSIWKRAFAALPEWPWTKRKTDAEAASGSDHLGLARESLRELVHDTRLPDGVRESLIHDYDAVQAMLDKIEHGHLHISVFGRVSTGKSSLLNALIGEERFSVSPIHGETRYSTMEAWNEEEVGGAFLIDTPGLDEAGGEDREALAKEVAGRSDLVIFVLDSDITETELDALRAVLRQGLICTRAPNAMPWSIRFEARPPASSTRSMSSSPPHSRGPRRSSKSMLPAVK
jgi:predicted GTPase